ncbi:hypothetical protein G210_2149 [Candida maltosa Xu316]|uniref:glucan 1,3-beta-glucosidase n=1 Tax=Candida maltosa (strain Xu316) TaxID=1245528 RepID=M3IVD1_CANMX|nr:hypothetical protein G210_2149 [Candida maltosa Xu316]
MPIDEYTLSSTLGRNMTYEYLKPHWDNFYTELDFEEIANLSLNLVRIPIGYWAFGLLPDDPYVQGQEKYLDMAIGWAAKHNLKIQIGIHGMPGSQNGFDNSGKTTTAPTWLEDGLNMELTYRVVDYVLNKYGNHSTVHSIQLVNEPLALLLDRNKISNFYLYCMNVANEKNIHAKLVFHDAFLNIEAWKDFPGEFILDHHLYEIFSEWQINLNLDQHLDSIRKQGESMARSGHRSIVGEFSGAMTDCAKYINGVGKGSRWDGTFQTQRNGSCLGHDNYNNLTFKNSTMSFLQEQFYTYEEKGSGWIFWCWKTESTLNWDMKRLHMFEMLPTPLFRYENLNEPQPEETFSSQNVPGQNTRNGQDDEPNNTKTDSSGSSTSSSTKNETSNSSIEYTLWSMILFIWSILIFDT